MKVRPFAEIGANRIKKQGVLMVAESADELAKLYLLTERYSDAEDLLNDAIATITDKNANNKNVQHCY